MRYSVARWILMVAAVAGTAGCAGDVATAPVSAVAANAGPMLSKAARGRTTESTGVITVDPTRSRLYHFGQNWLFVPAGAVCTLETPYGAAEWDKPCDRAIETIDVTVTVDLDANGRPAAQFSPELRFAPASDPSGWVVLGLKVKGRLDAAGYGILYQPTGSSELIDEAATDPTLRAWRQPGNVIARRVKHFSGYNVSLGFAEQEPVLRLGISLGGW